MDKKIKLVSSETLAISLISKMKERIVDIERMRIGQLTKPLVKEWKRLKLLEKEMVRYES